MKFKISLIHTFVLMLLFIGTSWAQEIPNAPVTNDRYLGNNAHDYNDVSGVNVVKEKTQEQINLENEILSLKREDNPANISRIEQLSNQLGEMTGNFSTKVTPYPGGGIVAAQVQNPPFAPDNITNIRIYNDPARTIKGLATCTEMRGTTAGRIWVVYAFSANTSSPDSLRVLYSVNGGLTWNLYALAWLGGTDKINYDDLDAEIVEPSTGAKYLQVVYGLRSSGGTGTWFTGGLTLNITTFAGGLYAFAWPGNSTAKRYYNIRITSDNANYITNSWTYIACSFDSTDGSNIHVNTQKYARNLNPYTTTPTFSYQGRNYWWYSAINPGVVRNLFTDIAYIRHGSSDSIIVSFNGVPDSTKVFFSKTDIGGNPTTGNGATNQGGSEPNAYKQYARISSNGYDNGSVICVFRQFYPSNWNVKYFRTTNYGNFSSIFQSVLWGSPANTSYQPDIVGLRNVDRHYFAFTTIASSDSVHYVGVTPSGGTTHIQKMNFIGLTSGTQGPKPGYRYVGSDSCFVLYSESGPFNVWAAEGCSGAITGVSGNGNQIPQNYALFQNYPNPFNPSTSIRYNLPVAGLVKMVVYDILGREIASPVNEIKTPGSYIVSFDASNLPSGVYFYKITAGNFTDTKKMLLVK